MLEGLFLATVGVWCLKHAVLPDPGPIVGRFSWPHPQD
ncbi:hypothetical protein CHCC5025_1151 [Bacillus licheniformis]|nr:hypothetical protein CHCC5025_1151 [Bacillus licheniformis]TWJ82584.1 hypothetical protein CHCC20497_2054 [Bacillus paralicheniformis]TWK70928.1 hypothetical protein CHCC20342_2595 [Bacillus licheniformis]TWM96194.1 hypothetical protein CHCC14596_2328 [Bacillus licheniformis]